MFPQSRSRAPKAIDVLTDYVYWIFWIFIGLLIGVRARPQSQKSLFRIIALGAGLVMAGLVIGLTSGHSVARLLVFHEDLVAIAGLELRLIVFGYTLILAGLLMALRGRAARKPDVASGSSRR